MIRCLTLPGSRPRSLCASVRARCAPGEGWATSRERAGRTLAELLTCARPGCVRRVRPARPRGPVPASVAALCPVCRTQYLAYRSKSLGHDAALALVMRPLQPRRRRAA